MGPIRMIRRVIDQYRGDRFGLVAAYGRVDKKTRNRERYRHVALRQFIPSKHVGLHMDETQDLVILFLSA